MKQIVTAISAQAIDHDAIHVKHVSGKELMLNAGKAVAIAAKAFCTQYHIEHVQIFCGKGNNGGDGYVAGIELKKMGIKNIDIFCFADKQDIHGDAKHFYDLLLTHDITPKHHIYSNELRTYIRESSIWIDAIFGTGLNRPVEGELKNILQCLQDNHTQQKVIAVDIPSGIHGTTGQLMGPAIKANKTLSMGFYKTGNFLHEAKAYSGEVALVKLDYPESSLALASPEIYLCDHELIRERLKPILITGHKFSAGQVLCVAGSAAMPGAVTLASLAALRGGAGMLRAYVPKDVKPLLLKRVIEAIVSTGKEHDILSLEDLEQILALQEKSRVMLIGPGMGRAPATGKLVRALLEQSNLPMVLDADALYHISPEELKRQHSEVIITPHSGEFARLLKIQTQDVLNAPLERARELALQTGTIVHLKGSTSLTALPSGRVFIHTTGAPGMATAGSGDLLAGLIASFIAQGHKPEDAVLIAVYYHGTAGQAAAEQLGNRSMIASDILEYLPQIIKNDEVIA